VTWLISPPLSHRTPLASLDGYELLLECPNCGDRIKSVSALYKAVDRCREIGTIIPRLSCDQCAAKPVRLRAVNSWVRQFDRETSTVDLTFLLSSTTAQAA
jgi:hypothetical protein